MIQLTPSVFQAYTCFSATRNEITGGITVATAIGTS